VAPSGETGYSSTRAIVAYSVYRTTLLLSGHHCFSAPSRATPKRGATRETRRARFELSRLWGADHYLDEPPGSLDKTWWGRSGRRANSPPLRRRPHHRMVDRWSLHRTPFVFCTTAVPRPLSPCRRLYYHSQRHRRHHEERRAASSPLGGLRECERARERAFTLAHEPRFGRVRRLRAVKVALARVTPTPTSTIENKDNATSSEVEGDQEGVDATGLPLGFDGLRILGKRSSLDRSSGGGGTSHNISYAESRKSERRHGENRESDSFNRVSCDFFYCHVVLSRVFENSE